MHLSCTCVIVTDNHLPVRLVCHQSHAIHDLMCPSTNDPRKSPIGWYSESWLSFTLLICLRHPWSACLCARPADFGSESIRSGVSTLPQNKHLESRYLSNEVATVPGSFVLCLPLVHVKLKPSCGKPSARRCTELDHPYPLRSVVGALCQPRQYGKCIDHR